MTQLDLEWSVDADRVRSGVVDAWVAWCGCGWRCAVSDYSRKDNRERAVLLLERHRCTDAEGNSQ